MLMFVILLGSRSAGMNTTARIPARAPQAATAAARLPVEAQANVSNPNARARAGDRHRAVLEGEGRVNRIVLDINLPQAEQSPQVIGLHQWRPARVRLDDGLVVDWQQRPIAPHGLWSGGD